MRCEVITAVIFDLDRTLLDRDQSVLKFIDGQYERFNRFLGHIPREDYCERFVELDNHGYVSKDRVYQQLVNEFNIYGISRDELLQDYFDRFKNYCIPFPHLVTMLEELKKHHLKTGIITNGQGQFQLDNIRAMGIEEYFDVILVSEIEGIKKPDPQIFMRALRNLNVSPHESVFIGDHPDNDVRAAQRVGMKTIWKRDSDRNDVHADYIISDLSEIPLLIHQLRSLI